MLRRSGTPWSAQDDADLRRLAEQGVSRERIGIQLMRTQQAVGGRLRELKRRAEADLQ